MAGHGRWRRLARIGLAAGILSTFAAPRAQAPAEGDAAEALRQARRLVDVVERIESHYQQLGAFRAPFSLQIVSPTFGAEEPETGVLHAVPPRKMLWDYEDPEGQKAVFDGESWWLVSPEDHTVTRHAVDPRQRSPLIDILAGERELLSQFSGRLVEPEAGPEGERVRLELVPREPREEVEMVIVTAEPKSGVVRRIEVVGPLGGSQLLELGKPVEEEPLAEERFEVTVPEGYTLLEE
jgi:outer membrane lipoprotein-sorting protein